MPNEEYRIFKERFMQMNRNGKLNGFLVCAMMSLVLAEVFASADAKKEEYTPERLKKCLEQKAPRLKDYEKAKYAFALKSAE